MSVRDLLVRLRNTLARREGDAAFDEEARFHIDMLADRFRREGLPPDEARRRALVAFGGRERFREAAGDEARNRPLEDLAQDVAYGVRSALRAPTFTLLAVLTLALGIGANAAVFGVLKSVLLDALPYAESDRLVRVYGHFRSNGEDRGPLSPGTIHDMRERQRSFASLAAFEARSRDAIYAAEEGPRVVKSSWVEPGLFRTLGTRIAIGRPLRDEDAESDTAHVVVLTHDAWQRLLGGDPAALGRTMQVNGISRTIVGVLPRGFVGPIADAELYFPLGLRASLRDPVGARRRQWLGAVGRLAPGVDAEAARRELAVIADDLAREHPAENGGIGVVAVPVRDAMVGDTRTPLLVLMASAALVLLITCANLAGALLSRTISRRKEFAVRVALGAGRGRIVRQLLTESTLLAVAGGIAGILLATLALGLLRGLASPALPAYADLSLDPGVLAFTSLLALVTGLAFGVAPALAVSRSDPQGTLRDESRGASESARSRRLRGVLVAGQIALCVSLLAGAGLLVRSLVAMTAAPLGFDAEGLMTVAVQIPPTSYRTTAARLRLIEEIEERLRALPGVIAVASTGEVPTRVMNGNGFAIEGAPPAPDDARPSARYATVSDDYFRTMRIPLLAGRTFGPEDHEDAPPTMVISEGTARRYWPAGGALGARLIVGPAPDAPPFTVVGIVGDVRDDPARPEPEPITYSSFRVNPWNGPFLVIRTEGDPLAQVRPIQRALASIDPGLPLHDPRTMHAVLADGLSGRRLPVVLMSAFGALALLLASVGVYAMFASMATAREREFGVRVALGSSRGAIAALVLRQGGVWMALGLVAGAGGVVLVARLLRDLLVRVRPFDPVALGIAVLVLLACGAAALLVPVRRATRVDPITAMRG